ncbi:MAG: zf-HC2 domain-containing protein [bacterium]|nr:zf-HC2 domain-containing protein [bacterium]
MNCERIELSIPDWMLGEVSPDFRRLISLHLEQCKSCHYWLETWMDFCDQGRDYITLPDTLDWQPFYQALIAYLQQISELLPSPSLVDSLPADRSENWNGRRGSQLD